jgi:hypothetical protein
LEKAEAQKQKKRAEAMRAGKRVSNASDGEQLVELEFLSLYLGKNNITDSACVALVQKIEAQPSLKSVSLNLVHNHVGVPFCREVTGKLLSKHAKVHGVSLDLLHTAIGTEGSKMLLKAALLPLNLDFLALDLGIQNTAKHNEIVDMAKAVKTHLRARGGKVEIIYE